MFYTIYKVTNKINDKFYIGKHQTINLDDTYMGSGKFINIAIEKYGLQNFQKDILFIFDTEDEMNNKEKELISEELIKSKQCYNYTPGGHGGALFTGLNHSEETKQILREISTGYKHTQESKDKMSKAREGRIFSEETRLKIGSKASQRYKDLEYLEKFKESAKKRPKRTLSQAHKDRISESVKNRLRLKR